MSKKEYGQFYTTNTKYIINNLIDIIPENSIVIDPYVGNGDLIDYLLNNKKNISIEQYDIDPKINNTIKQDTLLNPPDYNNKWILTNPPYLARNKNKNKTLYNKYDLNDLYKISLKTIIGCNGGVIIIPLNFFSDKNSKIRDEFLSKYEILNLNIFEEQVFDDTTYTVCSFSFIKKENIEQSINTIFYPSKDKMILNIKKQNNYIFGDNFLDIINHNNPLNIKRLTNDLNLTPNCNLFLRAIDTGSNNGRIKLILKDKHFYGKKTDRTFATIVLPDKYDNLSLDKQKKICDKFNEILEKYRKEYRSLFLTNYRNSTTSYSRKRIGFDMAYKLISYIIKNGLF